MARRSSHARCSSTLAVVRGDHPIDPANEQFDEALYLALNPDIAEAVREGAVASGFAHWRATGARETWEGLRPTISDDRWYRGEIPQPTPDLEPGAIEAFDAETYIEHYSDLRTAYADQPPAAARQHWLEHGWLEGRSAPGVATFARRVSNAANFLSRPFGVNFYAPFGSEIGLGRAARGYLRALREAAIPVQIRNFDISTCNPRITREQYDTPPRYRINLLQANPDTVTRLWNLFPAETFRDAYNIVIWAWELKAFRQEWFHTFGAVDEIWGMSRFTAEAVAAVSPVPVLPMNCAVEAPAAPPEAPRDRFFIPAGHFVFLNVFDIGSSLARKNPLAVVDAFREAFGAAEPVTLVIKFHSEHHDRASAAQMVRQLSGIANIMIISDLLSPSDMATLQHASDCLISAHRSEGFGLNIAEFMALGKPVIATAYSGNLDFMDEENSFPVAYRLVAIDRSSGPYQAGCVWAEPDQDDLVRRLRQVFRDRAEANRRGAAGAHTIRTLFDPAAVGSRMRERLVELGLDFASPPFARLLGRSAGIRATRIWGSLAVEDQAAVRRLAMRPTFSLLLAVHNTAPAALDACIRSVFAQGYPFWELCLFDAGSVDPKTKAIIARYQGTDARLRIMAQGTPCDLARAENALIELTCGTFIVFLDPSGALSPDALFELAQAINADPGVDGLYGDDELVDAEGGGGHLCPKQEWSPEALESRICMGRPLGIRKTLLLRLGGFRSRFADAYEYDLVLRVSRAGGRMHHIARALCRFEIAGETRWDYPRGSAIHTAARLALEDHVAQKFGEAAAVESGLLPGTFRVRRSLLAAPPVSVLITTGGISAETPDPDRISKLDALIAALDACTDYPRFSIHLAGGDALSATQYARVDRKWVTVTICPDRAAGVAEAMNVGLRQVRTEHVVLMSDTIEVFDPMWLRALMEFLQDTEIGAVSGRVVGPSSPGSRADVPGLDCVIHNPPGLQPACFATRKSAIAQAGGFDRALPRGPMTALFCLKLRDLGYRLVYTPYSEVREHKPGSGAVSPVSE